MAFLNELVKEDGAAVRLSTRYRVLVTGCHQLIITVESGCRKQCLGACSIRKQWRIYYRNKDIRYSRSLLRPGVAFPVFT